MSKLAIIFSSSIIFLFSCSSNPNNNPLADIVSENKIGYVQTSCMQNPDNGPRMISRQDKYEYINRDDYFDCVDRTSASIEAQSEEEILNKENELKLLPKEEGIEIINFQSKDIVRHRLVDKIVKAYSKLKK